MSGRCVLLTVMTTVLFVVTFSRAEHYVWPLEARPAITSTFCEYRPGHFHSGIDLKTWGEVGLRVYAIGDGYVWRVKTSPWGSGRAVYVKSTSGLSAAYFHLSAFHSSIRHFVEKEQERLGRYSIDLFLSPEDVPVVGGQVIGYSGESGIGGPHLHFELRDAENRPLNPLKHGFTLKDTIPPVMTKLSISPMNRHATVNGSRTPLILPVHRVRDGLYRIDQHVIVSGCVGFGVSLYDRANAARNRLAVYRLELTVDGEPVFRTRYDLFSFDLTRQVDLDRDFALRCSGEGTFQRLYAVSGNTLPFYSETGPGMSALNETCASSPPCAWTSTPGWHAVRIVGADANGNEATVEMNVLVDRSPEILTLEGRRGDDGFVLEALARDEDNGVRGVLFEYSTDFGEKWTVVAVDSTNSPPDLYRAELREDATGIVLGRAKAYDVFGVWSSPEICSVSERDDAQHPGEPVYGCTTRFRNTFIVWTITSALPLGATPRVTLVREGRDSVPLSVTRFDTDSFSVFSSYEPVVKGRTVLRIEGRDVWGTSHSGEIPFETFSITRADGGVVTTADGRVSAAFQPLGVYGNLWASIEKVAVQETSLLPMRSDPYRFSPDDVPFPHGAHITIQCGLTNEYAERAGVYQYRGDGEWGYVDSRVDTLKGLISADVFSFGTFALLEDTIPPSIWSLRPKEGSHVKAQNLRLFARVKDRGSGLGREEDLVMVLDGRRVISEYDPEGEWLVYKVKGPLSRGSHRMRVSVTDLAGNTTVRESRFRVME